MAEIKIYARFRPLPKEVSRHKHLCIDDGGIVRICVGDKQIEKFSGNPYVEHSFKFNQVFDENATQQQIFDGVIVEMIDKFLEGYNGTLFAYGQTASGKTYTIEGGARQFDERGIIPRTISYIYSAIESRKKATEEEGGENLATIHISYLEIYQDTGYDLLNPGNRNEGMMLNLPKVSVMESPTNEEVYIRHLSSHLASNEQMALSLLFQGSTCRRVAETTMNLSSSRSHTIFTITLATQKQGSDVRIRSKLNLVDLAGSERVYKTCATGQILQEAKHINLSLHYLEHVIVVLQKRALASKSGSQPVTPSCSTNSAASSDYQQLKTAGGGRTTGFVPYRNSLLTMVLRDSLGGNCITAMIANLSLEKNNVLETLSTCRFSQRVACISNKARRNEELDNAVLIRRLKERVQLLQQELDGLKSLDTATQPHCGILTDEQKKRCHKILYDFLHGKITDPITEGINNPSLFTEALTVMKDVITHTIKENKKYKQNEAISKRRQMVNKSIQVSVTNCDRSNVLSPFTTLSSSTSPQSQISSGFVSLKDDDDPAYDNSCSEKHKRVMTSNSERNTTKEVLFKVGSRGNSKSKVAHTWHHAAELEKGKSKLQETTSTNHQESQLTCSKSIQEVVDLKPPEIKYKKPSSPPVKGGSVESVKKERQNLIRKVNSLNQEMLQNTMRLDVESVSGKLAIQHAKVLEMQRSGASFDEIITEKKIEQHLKLKMDRISAKLKEIKSDIDNDHCEKKIHDNIKTTNHSNHPKHTSEEIQDLRLEKLQKQLELKEAATMRRLLALKSELESHGNTNLEPNNIMASMKQTISKGKVDHFSPKMERDELHRNTAHPATRIEGRGRTNNLQQSVESIEMEPCEPNRKLYNGLKSPQPSSEKLYSKELQRHKTRVTQIRQCIKAAITIQRAWRRYNKKT